MKRVISVLLATILALALATSIPAAASASPIVKYSVPGGKCC